MSLHSSQHLQKNFKIGKKKVLWDNTFKKRSQKTGENVELEAKLEMSQMYRINMGVQLWGQSVSLLSRSWVCQEAWVS